MYGRKERMNEGTKEGRNELPYTATLKSYINPLFSRLFTMVPTEEKKATLPSKQHENMFGG